VAHACNPSFSGDRDQEDRGSKPAQANSLLLRPYLKKNPSQKKSWRSIEPEPVFKPQLWKKRKKKERKKKKMEKMRWRMNKEVLENVAGGFVLEKRRLEESKK
jgi:hypothetical protein